MQAILFRLGRRALMSMLKLVNQLPVRVHMAAAAEAAALLQALDLPTGQSAAVLNSGWADSVMLERGLAQLAAGKVRDTGVTIGGMTEVQALIDDVLCGSGVDAQVFTAARRRFDGAASAGTALDDPAALRQLMAAGGTE